MVRLLRRRRVFRLQAIISNRAKRSDTYMSNRKPSFHFVMTGAMENIGNPDRCGRASCFQRGESSVVIDDIVREKYFAASAR